MRGEDWLREPPVPHRGGYRQDWLLEVARTRSDIREGRRWNIRTRKPVGEPRKAEPPQVMKYVELAEADGFRPTSIDQGRQVLLRYGYFLSERGASDLESAGWEEFAAYKSHLARSGVSRATVRCYLFYVAGFYRLRAQASQRAEFLDDYMRVRAIGVGRPAKGRKWRPLKREMVQRLLRVAEGEDRVFLTLLLYTGGRAQFYGLRVEEVDFERGEITTDVKAGKIATLPLHPKLGSVLIEHLATRGYSSGWLLRHGKDGTTLRGQRSNRQNAWRICRRVQLRAGVEENVHPHRFRKTLAAYMCEAGLDPQFL